MRRAILAAALAAALAAGPAIPVRADSAAPPEGAQPFARGELYLFLAGKTLIRPEGGAFHGEDGGLETFLDGERARGSWSVTPAGALCWHVYDWGERACEAFWREGGAVRYRRADGAAGAPELADGNVLDYLEAGRAPPAEGEPLDPHIGKDFLTPEEAVRFVAGRSAILEPHGAVYYAPDFTLATIWNGVRQKGRWSVDGKGGVCWHVAAWGVEPCRYYYREDGATMSVYKGAEGPAETFVEGDLTAGP